MKKVLICLILMIAMFSTSVDSYADNVNEAIPFSTTLLGLFNQNAKEWMYNERSQALCAICAVFDYASLENMPYDISNFYSGSVFIGQLSTTLAIGFKDKNEDDSLLIFFDTGDPSKAYYSVMPLDEKELKSTLEESCADGVYELDSKLLEEIRDVFTELLGAYGMIN